MLDYIIVGNGLAGIAFAETAISNNKKIHLFGADNLTSSTNISGGLYNPIVLKRFTDIWKSKEQIDISLPFYQSLQNKLNIQFLFPLKLYRKFSSVQEQNNWFFELDKPNLHEYMQPKLFQDKLKHIKADYGFGEVNFTGYVNTKLLQDTYKKYLISQNSFTNEVFDYNSLKINDYYISYKGLNAKSIVFAEGFALHNNPYFNNLPLDGTKGELLLIYAPDLDLSFILKSSIFILPLGNGYFKVGATYNWTSKSNETTQQAKEELVNNLNETISCNYEIINQFAGVRPTVKDRRPLVGRHNSHKNLYVLNGLGTRGVMLAPFLAHHLYNFIENNVPLYKEIAVDRIYKKLY